MFPCLGEGVAPGNTLVVLKQLRPSGSTTAGIDNLRMDLAQGVAPGSIREIQLESARMKQNVPQCEWLPTRRLFANMWLATTGLRS